MKSEIKRMEIWSFIILNATWKVNIQLFFHRPLPILVPLQQIPIRANLGWKLYLSAPNNVSEFFTACHYCNWFSCSHWLKILIII